MKCPVCLNNKNFKCLRPFFCKADNHLCKKCGLVFIPERPKLLQRYYKDDGYFKKSPNIACKKQFISKSLLIKEAGDRVKQALEILPINFRGKSVLDIGCGYGEIIYFLKKTYGSKIVGIEASLQTAEYGNHIFSVPIHPMLLEEFKTKNKFDIILCSHTLEHVNNPDFFLEKIKNLISQNGLIYIEVPNILKPTGGFSLNSFFYNEHLQTFSTHNIMLLLKRHNLNVVAYSDENFLKFWCKLSGEEKQVPKITAEQILFFLKKYKKEYSILDFIKVYNQKLIYGLKLTFYRVCDLLT